MALSTMAHSTRVEPYAINLLARYRIELPISLQSPTDHDCFGRAAAALLSFEIQRKFRDHQGYIVSKQHLVDHIYNEFPKGLIDGSIEGYKSNGSGKFVPCPYNDKDVLHYYADGIATLSYVQVFGVCSLQDYPDRSTVDIKRKIKKDARKVKITEIGVVGGNHESARRALDRGHPVLARVVYSESLRQFDGKGQEVLKTQPSVEEQKDDLGHIVLLIGYGVTKNGEHYYLVLNSYGETWAEKGIGKISCDLVSPQAYAEDVFFEDTSEPSAASEPAATHRTGGCGKKRTHPKPKMKMNQNLNNRGMVGGCPGVWYNRDPTDVDPSNCVYDRTHVGDSSRKKQPVNSLNWEPQRGRILNLIANSLEINLSLLFGSSDPDENYLSFIMKNAFLMFENMLLLKDSDTKDALCRIIRTCATKYHYLAQSCASILHMIHKYDFVVTHFADAVAGAEKRYADGSMATSLIREIGRMNPKDYVKNTVGAENIGRFLVELAERLPKLLSTNICLLVPHFGRESYKIRNALVRVLGKLIAKAFNDVEGEVSSKSIRLRTKQAMLVILLERCRDVSAYTRSRVLQVWAELCEEHSVSIGLWNEVATLASGRLEDKSAIVRKSALNLLIMLLQHNPFGPQLRATSFEATLEQYKKKLTDLTPKCTPKNEPLLDNEVSRGDSGVEDEEVEGVSQNQDSLSDSCLPNAGDDQPQVDNSVSDVGNVEQTRTLVASLEAGLRFSKCISATMPTLVQLMASSSSGDVENTILLLMRCRQFQIEESETCLRKMLPLVLSQDKSIYEAVENAFITICIRKNPVETAKNLLNLAIDSNIGDLAALEFILGALVAKGEITASMLSALWAFFCFNINGTTAVQSRGALSVLCMAAKSSPIVLSSHLQEIVDIGFGRWAKVEPLLARTACVALQRLCEEDKKKLLSTNGTRVFGILDSLVSGFSLSENIWYAAADRAIAALYAIHPTPETVAADLVKKSLKSAFESSEGSEIQTNIDSGTTVQVTKLSRYLFVVSHVALNQLVYIESSMRKIQKAKSKKERMDADIKNLDANTSSDAQKDDGINSELGLASSEDAMLDSLAERAEKEILSSASAEKNLIGHCAPFVSKLCRNFGLMHKYPELQASGMLALCRLMIIDADFWKTRNCYCTLEGEVGIVIGHNHVIFNV